MASGVRFEWDEAKRQSNLTKHEVDFVRAVEIDWTSVLTVDQPQKGEDRKTTYAPIDNRLFVLVWTPRDGAVRIISLRKANRREVKRYARE